MNIDNKDEERKEPKTHEEWLRKYEGIPRWEAYAEKIYYLLWGIFVLLFLILLVLFFKL